MWRPFGRAGRRDLEDGLESEEDELLENEHGERRADSLTELGTAAVSELQGGVAASEAMLGPQGCRALNTQ